MMRQPAGEPIGRVRSSGSGRLGKRTLFCERRILASHRQTSSYPAGGPRVTDKRFGCFSAATVCQAFR
jgi:hypothetical protein